MSGTSGPSPKSVASRKSPIRETWAGVLRGSGLLLALIHPSAQKQCTAHPRSRVLLIPDMDEEHVRRAAKIVASEL